MVAHNGEANIRPRNFCLECNTRYLAYIVVVELERMNASERRTSNGPGLKGEIFGDEGGT